MAVNSCQLTFTAPVVGIKFTIRIQIGRNTHESEREVIESYFLAGFEFDAILCFLSKYHGVNISMSHLLCTLTNN